MKSLPWFASLVVHGIVLMVGGIAYQPAAFQFGASRGSLEVSLVATPAEENGSVLSPAAQPESKRPPAPMEAKAAVSVPQIQRNFPAHPVPRSEAPARIAARAAPIAITPAMGNEFSKPGADPRFPESAPVSGASGPGPSLLAPSDGGRPAAGSATGTAQASALIDAEPDYLHNPPPVYPSQARELGQEGVVVVDVAVDPDGRPESFRVSGTSGYHLLDQAALAAARDYRFRPATVGGIPIRSHVRVPFRFRLDN